MDNETFLEKRIADGSIGLGSQTLPFEEQDAELTAIVGRDVARASSRPRAHEIRAAKKRNERQRRRDRAGAAERRRALAIGAPAPKIYDRICNRCNKPYKGTGRVLCATCREVINGYGPLAEGI